MNVKIQYIVTAISILMVCVGSSPAATRTWKNNTTGDWFTAANWNEGAVPVAGDDVVITNTGASVTLTNSTAWLSSVTLGKTLTFTNWDSALNVTNVTVQSGGSMMLPAAFTNNGISNNIYVACSNLTIDAGGSINADAKGYAGGVATNGHGPGGGQKSNNDGAGGGYGGSGCDGGTDKKRGGSPYGSTNMPTEPGSGGGGTGSGGHGGGAILINASGTVTVNGTITADGGAGVDYSGGGSGGGIYITCRKLIGTSGVLRAKGGNPGSIVSRGGGGGGGRIAVIYDQAAQSNEPVPDVTFSAAGASGFASPGDIGTLYFPDNRFLTENIKHIGQWIAAGSTNWSANNLILSNVWIRFPVDGFQLTVTNDFTVMGNTGRLDLGKTLWTNLPTKSSGNISGCTNSSLLEVGGNLTLTNSGSLYVYSGLTNASMTNYGALVSVTNDVYIDTNSWIYPYPQFTNGGSSFAGSPLFRMRNLVISSNGGFNADAKGYSGGYETNGYGPGGGAKTPNTGGGGGYGGKGGDGGLNYPKGGHPYGFADMPMEPGSGGGGGSGVPGGHGGGVIRINASDTVTVNGTITANGGSGGSYSAGGSGGGIYVTCRRLIGTGGIVRANGGTGAANYGGGGGGGRIAVIYDQAAQSNEPVPNVVFSAAGVSGGAGYPTTMKGDIGTFYFPDNRFLTENITHIGQWITPGFTNWSPNSLTISNGWIRFPADGFRLTVSNDVMIAGSTGRLDLGNILWTNYFQYSDSTNLTVLEVGGNLTLTNGGCLHICSGMTNASTTNYGALVSVTNDVFIFSTNSWICPYSHYTNGGSAQFRMRNLFISTSNAGFSANGLGFASKGSNSGYGPGSPSNHYAGAGHGGRGGTGKGYPNGGGPTYGDSNAPVVPGSGGSGGSVYPGGSGGGLLRIHVRDTLTVNGTITANGGNSWDSTFGGGSGGGIYITTRTFTGANGWLRASGGNGGSAYGGGGGGGRIAIWRVRDRTGGTIQTYVNGGVAWSNGVAGTVVWGWLPPARTIVRLH